MEVIAVESGDFAGWAESATALGEVEFDSLASFVDNVLDFLRGDKMHKLHLQAHGNTTTISFGSDTLDLDNFKTQYRGQLSRLAASFAPNAIVVLRACEIGQNLTLLANLAGAWNVTIIAGRGLQNNILNFNTGRYVTITPDGTVDSSFFLPPQAAYEKYGADMRLGQKIINAFR